MLSMALLLLIGCTTEGFENSEIFTRDYENRSESLQECGYLDIFNTDLSTQQRQAMQFLYAYMPLPDITD